MCFIDPKSETLKITFIALGSDNLRFFVMVAPILMTEETEVLWLRGVEGFDENLESPGIKLGMQWESAWIKI